MCSVKNWTCRQDIQKSHNLSIEIHIWNVALTTLTSIVHRRVKNSSIFTLSYVSVLFLCAQWHWRKIFSRQNGVSYAGSSSKVVIIISHRLEINQAKLGGDFHLVKLDWDVPLPFLWLWEITKSDSKTVCQLWAFCNATNSIQDYSEWLVGLPRYTRSQ